MSLKERNACGTLREEHVGERISVSGWVNRRRDHGGLIFIDLRDRSGLLQIVFDGNFPDFSQVERLRNEFVIQVTGTLRLREEGAINDKLPTGKIELVGETLEILNTARTPVFDIADQVNVDENVRLKYRYLDLRRKEMQDNLILRHQVTMVMRKFLDQQGFLEIETPMLGKSTPEGARDYLVPSRIHPGKFYALPQLILVPSSLCHNPLRYISRFSWLLEWKSISRSPAVSEMKISGQTGSLNSLSWIWSFPL